MTVTFEAKLGISCSGAGRGTTPHPGLRRDNSESENYQKSECLILWKSSAIDAQSEPYSSK